MNKKESLIFIIGLIAFSVSYYVRLLFYISCLFVGAYHSEPLFREKVDRIIKFVKKYRKAVKR